MSSGVSLNQFRVKISTDPEVVIGLYPHLLPSDRRRLLHQAQPTRPPTLSGEHLDEGMKHLITYLTQVCGYSLSHPHTVTLSHPHTLTHTCTLSLTHSTHSHLYTFTHSLTHSTHSHLYTLTHSHPHILTQRRSTEKQTFLRVQKGDLELPEEDIKKLVGTVTIPFHDSFHSIQICVELHSMRVSIPFQYVLCTFHANLHSIPICVEFHSMPVFIPFLQND